jgi:hypothetical protein
MRAIGHGLTEQSEVRLDFLYNAPNLNAANDLATFLQVETDSEISSGV